MTFGAGGVRLIVGAVGRARDAVGAVGVRPTLWRRRRADRPAATSARGRRAVAPTAAVALRGRRRRADLEHGLVRRTRSRYRARRRPVCACDCSTRAARGSAESSGAISRMLRHTAIACWRAALIAVRERDRTIELDRFEAASGLAHRAGDLHPQPEILRLVLEPLLELLELSRRCQRHLGFERHRRRVRGSAHLLATVFMQLSNVSPSDGAETTRSGTRPGR